MAKDHNISERPRPSPSPSQSPSINAKRDAQGRFSERTIRMTGRLGDFTETRRYAYDAAGRLSRVTDQRGGLCESYTFDQQGRRLADICPELRRGERRFSYGPGNRLGQAGSAQYGHNKAGFRNLKVEGNAETRYKYEPSGLLLAVDLPDGRRIDYAYDASGLRTEKRVNGRVVAEYIWLDPLRLGAFSDGREWWRLLYDGQGRSPVGVENERESYLMLCDQVGTPLALATTDGSIVQAMQYDSFGNLLQVRSNVLQLPLGFAGGLFDPDTGLTRFPWRDYDSGTGRFTALDPLREKGGDKDWYGYCVDDPVNRVDVWGLFWGDTPAGRILRSGAKGGIIGAYKGFRWGSAVGEPVPGAIVGGAIGTGEGMATQTVLEYPPVKNKLEEWEAGAQQQLGKSWEAAGESEGTADNPWASIYDAPPD